MAPGSTKKAARITIEAPVTSFRYPHFLIGRQVSFRMPPPSTIYGHVASALGSYPELPFEFAYHFQYRALARDLEHQQIITRGKKYPKNIEATVQPHQRDFLFEPRLTLYLQDMRLAECFLAPVFCVVLGRSQDLAMITKVEEVELVETDGAYFENTLLPFFPWRAQIAFGTTVQMPCYIEPPPERRAHFARYIQLEERIWAGNFDRAAISDVRTLLNPKDGQRYWIDPDTSMFHGVQRGVCFHHVSKP